MGWFIFDGVTQTKNGFLYVISDMILSNEWIRQ